MNMTTAELRRQRKSLEDELAELSLVLRNRESIAIEQNADALDEVQGAVERELAIRTLDRGSQVLRSVRAALARIDDGTWGICMRCEEDINPKRLNAVPWAPYCISCQEWADGQKAKGYEYEYESVMFEGDPAQVA
jgi:DnaK suppressor protein